MPTILKNIDPPKSAIDSIVIPDGDLPDIVEIHYRDGRVVFLAFEKIVFFYNKCSNSGSDLDHTLAPALLSELKSRYAHVFEDYQKNLTSMSQEEANEIYEKLYQQVFIKHQAAIERGKPLLILAGENHYSSESLLYELMLLEIAKGFGIRNIQFELKSDEGFQLQDMRDSRNMPMLLFLARRDNMKIGFLEEKQNLLYPTSKTGVELRDSQMALRLGKENLDRFAKNYEKYKQERNRTLQLHIEAKQQQLLDAPNSTSVTIQAEIEVTNQHENSIEREPTICVVGASHLKRLVEPELMAFSFEILPLNISDTDQKPRSYRKDNESFREEKEFALNSKQVVRICAKNRVYAYENTELYKMALLASQKYIAKRIGVIRAEYKQIKDKMCEVLAKAHEADAIAIAENLIRVVEALVENKEMRPDLIRIEMYIAVQESKRLIEKKHLLGTFIDIKIGEIQQLFLEGGSDIPTLTKTQLLNAHHMFKLKPTPKHTTNTYITAKAQTDKSNSQSIPEEKDRETTDPLSPKNLNFR